MSDVDTVTEPAPGAPLPEGAEPPPPGVRAAAIVRWLLVLAAAAAAAYAILHGAGVLHGPRAARGTWSCPMHPHVVQDHPGECPICFMSLVERGDPAAAANHAGHAHAHAPAGDGAYWCPMHPDVTSDDPEASCEPCGGMKLIPRPGGPADPDGAAAAAPGPALVPIELTTERIQHIGLRTAPVARRTLTPTLRALATLGAPEAGWAQVTPRVAGWLERVHVAETGARIKRGQALATLHSPELLAAQEEYLAALAWADAPALPALPGAGGAGGAAAPKGRSLAADARRRLELAGMAPADIDAITRSRTPLRAITLRAPVGGHLLARGAVAGGYVQPGAVLFEIADLSTVWAWIEIPERDVGRVEVGQAAALTVTGFPGERFDGRVTFLAPVVDPVARTLRARIELPNPGGRLRPGMSGEATVDLPAVEVVAIPDGALIDTGHAQYVFVATGAGRFEPRRVAVGRRIGGHVELRPLPSGATPVAEGEHVVTTGNFLLDAESRLQGQLGGAGGGHAGHGGAP